MTQVNFNLVEKYQKAFNTDPSSRIFAPLAEAYRKMGMLDEAIAVCLQGLQHNPDFAGGHVALAKVYIEQQNWQSALEHLKIATEHSPENLLAQSLLGETYLKLKRPKDALSAYKMTLFLNPTDSKAQKVVKSLESLTAESWVSEVFDFTPEETPSPIVPMQPVKSDLEIKHRSEHFAERALSLADAYAVRSDPDKAIEMLQNFLTEWGPHPQVQKRLEFMQKKFAQQQTELYPAPSPSKPSLAEKTRKTSAPHPNEQKIIRLKNILSRINSRRYEPQGPTR